MAHRIADNHTGNKILLNRNLERLFLLGIIILFTVLSIGSALSESLTFDEIVDVEDGLRALNKQDFSVNPYNPPFIQELEVLPIKAGLDKFIKSPYPAIQRLPSRTVNIFLGIILLISVFIATKIYFGQITALTSTALLAIEPTLLANSHYITLDTGTTLFFFLAFYYLIKVIKNQTLKNYIFLGLSTGALFASRIFGITYFISSLILIGLYWLIVLQKRFYISKKIFISLLICLFFIWGVYFFRNGLIIAKSVRSGRVSDKISVYAKSNGIPLIASVIILIKTTPMPLGNYIALIKNSALRNSGSGEVFFMGKKYPASLFYFIPVTLFLKTPVPLIILIFIGYYFVWRNRVNNLIVMFAAIPIAVITVAIISGMSPLFRYVLPAIPFFCIVAGYGAFSISNNRLAKIIVSGLFIWLVIGTVRNYPHFITYTNEFSALAGKKYEIFSDSNLDWGQGLISLNKYILQTKPKAVRFSYFGRDDAVKYGFNSPVGYGSYKADEICVFHPIKYYGNTGPALTIISVSNWNDCGYRKMKEYNKLNIQTVIADTFLIFKQ
jgi:hypothetical protein